MPASELRAQLLKSNPFRSKILDVETGDGSVIKVKVRQPSVEERHAIFAEAKVSKAGEVSGVNQGRMGALAVIYCVRDPDTDEPLFTVADLDSLLHLPANSWLDKLAGEVLGLLVEAQDLAKK